MLARTIRRATQTSFAGTFSFMLALDIWEKDNGLWLQRSTRFQAWSNGLIVELYPRRVFTAWWKDGLHGSLPRIPMLATMCFFPTRTSTDFNCTFKVALLGLHFFHSSVFPSIVLSSLSLESFIENAFTVKFMLLNTEAGISFWWQTAKGCFRFAEICRLHRQIGGSREPPNHRLPWRNWFATASTTGR